MAHLRGIPTYLRERHGIPVVFYDGDVPMSLPEFGGMDTGFNYYHGADPSEYDLVPLELRGRPRRLLELGARRAEAVLWAADPEFFRPLPVEKEPDVFFYGYGDKFRREWMAALVGEPSRRDPTHRLRPRRTGLPGRRRQRPRSSETCRSTSFARAISAARVNLNVTRRAHATVDGSSTCRPFELASAGAAIVSNPHDGTRAMVRAGQRAARRRGRRRARSRPTGRCSTIRREAEAMGARARERVLDEHTYAHRARQVLRLLGLESAVPA